jgi:hypothetical protein
MKRAFIYLFFPAIFLSSCELSNQAISKEDMLRNIRLCDNSYVGFLGFLHMEGKVENNNYFGIRDIEIKAMLFNNETHVTTYEALKVCVPITAYGSATYSQKFYVGSKVSVQRVFVNCVQRY